MYVAVANQTENIQFHARCHNLIPAVHQSSAAISKSLLIHNRKNTILLLGNNRARSPTPPHAPNPKPEPRTSYIPRPWIRGRYSLRPQYEKGLTSLEPMVSTRQSEAGGAYIPMGTKGFLTGFFPSSWKSSMWNGGGGGALPSLPFSIRVAGVEEKQGEKKTFATAAALRFGFAFAGALLPPLFS